MNLMSVLYFFSNLRSIKIFLSHLRSPQVYKNTADPFQNKEEENKDGKMETPRQKILPQDSKSYYLEVLIPVCVYSKVWMDIMWESALPYLMCIIRPDTRSQQSFQHHSNQKIAAATEFANRKKYPVSFFFSDHGRDKKKRDVILFWKNDAQGHARALYHGESGDKIRKEK